MKTTTANQVKKEYFREWRSKNKKRIREYNAKYWEKKAQKLGQEQQEMRGGDS